MPQKIYYINSKDLLCECTVIGEDGLFYRLQNDSGVEYIFNKTDCFETAQEATENQIQKNVDQINLLHDKNELLIKQLNELLIKQPRQF